MALFAPVAPLPVLQKLADAGALGTYHLLLAHDVVRHAKAYEKLFKHPNMHVIMDNSLIELGYPVDSVTMAEACVIVGADVAVLPDKLADSSETVRLVQRAFEPWLKTGIEDFLVVCQGRTIGEMYDCWEDISDLDPSGRHIKMWSVPKIVQRHMNTRQTTIGMLRDHGVTNIHLLGFSDNLNDDIHCCQANRDVVKGIDSAVPTRMGHHGMLLDRKHPAHAPRGDYMETAKDINTFVLDNVRLIREWVK